MAERREALKIIGAISSTCAFPYSADELYGQHAHHAADAPTALPSKPAFFTAAEFAVISRMADLILPATGSPGALAAGVPLYIDYVVSSSARWKKLFRQGIGWMDKAARGKHGKPFVELSEEQQVGMLTPLCEAADQAKPGPWRQGQTREEPKVAMEVSFFKAVKSMTADGFFTSKQGLIETLGYKGNSPMAEFPQCRS